MEAFLALTLAGETPAEAQGETAALRWQWLGEGILQLCPKAGYQRAVVLSAGIHGDETAPIELLNQLVDDLLQTRRPLAVRLLIILGNPQAMRAGRRYLYRDLNRLFGGRYLDDPADSETKRAAQLEQVMGAFFAQDAQGSRIERYHYDLHTAIRASHYTRFGLLPYQLQPYAAGMLAWLEAAELEALVVHRAPGGTFSHFSSEHCQAASCTLELGKAQPFGLNNLAQFQAINLALQSLVSEAPLPVRMSAPLQYYRVVQSLIRRSTAFRLHVSEETANFTSFTRGTLLAEQPGDVYRVVHDREWILFPNPNVALGLRAGLMLVAMSREGLTEENTGQQ